MYKISVLIPAYNIADLLPRCLESVMGQTYQNLEIIVIDDGSTDDTGKILDDYAQRDSRIVAVHQENAGLVAVRERGISMATGEYVGFVDGDDEIEPDMYERLLGNALKYKADISHCGVSYYFDDGRILKHYGTGMLAEHTRLEGLHELLSGRQVEPALWNKLYARHLLADSCLDQSILINEDLLRNYTLFLRAKKSVYEDFCGYRYFRRLGSMSNNPKRLIQINTDILRARRTILENAPDEVWTDAYRCYIQALIGAYNVTVWKKDAVKFHRECRSDLNGNKQHFDLLEMGMRVRAYAIQYLPWIYDVAQWVYRKLRFARIRRQVRNLK